MRLTDLMDGGLTSPPACGNPEITGLTADSRAVEPGYLFAALQGSRDDGVRFIADAAGRGARAVLAPPGTRAAACAAGLAFVAADNPRRAYARMAARFHAEQPRTVVAVTGTDGKTSVVWFARQLWQTLGHRAASLGTLGLDAPGFMRPGSLTTPDPAELHRILAAVAVTGIDHMAIEASSHGLAQHRLDGVRLDAAAFTTLGRDHLDYHRTADVYFAAKARLFAELLPAGAVAALNTGLQRFDDLRQICRARRHRVVTYGRGGDMRLASQDGRVLAIEAFGETYTVATALGGGFQVENLLAALTLVIGCGADPQAAMAAAGAVEGPPGRLQRVATSPGGAAVYVDYAHTPDALCAVLAALRPRVSGAIVLVFGCGGDRDPGKRPRMGAVAADRADRVFVTDDNPRGEDPAAIRAAIRAACPGAVEIGDRERAIAAAFESLGPDDVLLIAGKGHETGQIVGDIVRPFDDAAVARRVAAGGAP